MAHEVTMDCAANPFRIETRPYRRPFTKPLRAAWGTWETREGTLLRLSDPLTGRVGFGEIAPLPAAPDDADRPERSRIEGPCGDFALWSARQCLKDPQRSSPRVTSAALLTLGEGAQEEIRRKRQAGFRTFKLKAGLAAPAAEWYHLQAIADNLLPGEALRLDPNRSWQAEDWAFWEPRLGTLAGRVDFVEEPFAAEFSRQALLDRARSTPVPLALDESLEGPGLDEWLEEDWPGWWIIKPSLLGDPRRWLETLLRKSAKVVISSAFESGIGLTSLIHLAAHFPAIDHGLGTQSFFGDDFGTHQDGAGLNALSLDEQESLWNRLPAK